MYVCTCMNTYIYAMVHDHNSFLCMKFDCPFVCIFFYVNITNIFIALILVLDVNKDVRYVGVCVCACISHIKYLQSHLVNL